jgi:hypothetical protein
MKSVSNDIRRIFAMLQRCSGADPVFPPTDLFNEDWIPRLILLWTHADAALGDFKTRWKGAGEYSP